MVSPPPPFNPGHNADQSPIEWRSTNPDTNPDIPDFEAIIANQPVLFASGGPAAPNTPVTFATTVTEPAVEPTVEPTVEPVVEPVVEPAVEPAVEPTVGPSPEIEDEDEDNKLMIIAGVSLCVCMIVVAIFMMKR